MKLVSIVFDKAASEYKLYYKDEETGNPYHITANHLLDKEKLWARYADRKYRARSVRRAVEKVASHAVEYL